MPSIKQMQEAAKAGEDPRMAGTKPTPQENTTGAQTGGGSGQAVSPELQQGYERIVLAGSEVIFGDQTSGKVIEMLSSMANEPDTALSNLAVTLVTQLDEKSGGQIPEELVLPPVEEFIEQGAALAIAQQLFEVDQGVLDRAAQMALNELGPMYGVTPEEVEEFVASINPQERDAMAMAQQQSADARPQTPAPGGEAMPAGAPAQAGGQPAGVV